jgi:nitrate/TMAO reductase-like tetraheme cytochrome c subunit/mono/diheme cytochrome c family protein
MKRIKVWLKRFFFPPEGAPLWLRVLPYVVLGMLTLVVLVSSAYAWDYTNSPEFCGEACHTMPPEYTAYLTSPHARIDCVDCHIGKGFITTRITRKAGDAKHIIRLAFRDYEFPIRAEEMRPARETCELCHFPEKFSDDSLRELLHFASDYENTPSTTYLIMHTGGGSDRLGSGQGIHWHIENPVYYYALDHEEQEIPYVKVVNEDGSITEYMDLDSEIDPDQISPEDLTEIDCITCHNRITHLVKPPEKILDGLLASGVVSPDIPEIRRQAVYLFKQPYETIELALNSIAGLENFYKTYHPEFYAKNKALMQIAISALQVAYNQSVYPEQKSDWNSHPNNVGHQYSPGCFRCHDGKHLNPEKEAIRLECNLCHAIPVVADQFDFVADLEISRGPEPQSHLNPNWIGLHRNVFDQTCQNCHTIEDAGGTSNTSFCSNSACHGNVFEFAGFDAPALRDIWLDQVAEIAPPPEDEPDLIPTLNAVEEQAGDEPDTSAPPNEQPLPTETPPAPDQLTFDGYIGALFARKCGDCHGENAMVDLNLLTYERAMQGSANGPMIVPGDPTMSSLIEVQSGEMPHFGQLTTSELEWVSEWIAAGALEK